MKVPPPVHPGDTITAEMFNAVLENLRALANLRGVPPLRTVRGPGGFQVLLDERMRRFDAVIIGSPALPGPALPSTVSYDVRVLDRPDVGDGGEFFGVTPRHRPVRGDEVAVWPALLDSPCEMWFWPTAAGGRQWLLMEVNEVPAWGACAPGQAQ